MSEPTITETPAPNGIDLRALLAQRTEHRMRRIHRQWFGLEPQVEADLKAAEEKLAELVGDEIRKQQLHQAATKKYSMPTAVQTAETRYRELKARSRAVGVMGVFKNLTDTELDDVLAVKDTFAKAKAILTTSWLRWEDADGNTIPDETFGRAELDLLMQPEVLERGEWLPLATKIVNESSSAPDRPTLPA